MSSTPARLENTEVIWIDTSEDNSEDNIAYFDPDRIYDVKRIDQMPPFHLEEGQKLDLEIRSFYVDELKDKGGLLGKLFSKKQSDVIFSVDVEHLSKPDEEPDNVPYTFAMVVRDGRYAGGLPRPVFRNIQPDGDRFRLQFSLTSKRQKISFDEFEQILEGTKTIGNSLNLDLITSPYFNVATKVFENIKKLNSPSVRKQLWDLDLTLYFRNRLAPGFNYFQPGTYAIVELDKSMQLNPDFFDSIKFKDGHLYSLPSGVTTLPKFSPQRKHEYHLATNIIQFAVG